VSRLGGINDAGGYRPGAPVDPIPQISTAQALVLIKRQFHVLFVRDASSAPWTLALSRG
jgi:hypothetical protein